MANGEDAESNRKMFHSQNLWLRLLFRYWFQFVFMSPIVHQSNFQCWQNFLNDGRNKRNENAENTKLSEKAPKMLSK